MYQINYGNITTGAEIVSLELAKQNSNIEYTSDDVLLKLFLDAIALEIENYIGQPVLQRDTVTVKLKHWESPYSLPILFNEITSITYRNSALAEIPLVVDEDYEIFLNELNLYDGQPSDYKGPITITGSAGYTVANMPKHFKDAAMLMFTERETFRENRPVKMNTSAKEILRPHKRF